VIDGAVALAAADFHEADELFQFAVPDAGAYAIAGDHDLAGENAARAVGPRQQALADDGFEAARKLGNNLRLLVRGEDIDEAVDGLRRVGRVKGGEHEVAGFRGGEGDADGVEIAHFGNDDDVRILAQRLAQGARETFGIATDLALFDEAGAVRVKKLNGIFKSDDDAAAAFRDAFHHRGERRGLAGAGDAGDEDESAAFPAKSGDHFVMAELFDLRNLLVDETERGLHIAARDMDVAAEAADAFHVQGVVEFQFLFECRALGLGEGVEHEIADGFRVDRLIRQGLEHAVDSRAGRRPRAEVEVGPAAADGLAQEFGDVGQHGG